MADPDSQAQLRPAGPTNGKAALTGPVTSAPARGGTTPRASGGSNGRVAKRDSEDIVAEIERTRQSLARTIDTLADRVSPASNARRLRERATEELRKPEVQLATAAVALAVTGIIVYRIWGRRRG